MKAETRFHEFNKAICEAIGVSADRVRKLTITLQPMQPPIVVTELVIWPGDLNGDAMQTVVGEFELVPRKQVGQG